MLSPGSESAFRATLPQLKEKPFHGTLNPNTKDAAAAPLSWGEGVPQRPHGQGPPCQEEPGQDTWRDFPRQPF